MREMVRLESLARHFGPIRAVEDVSLVVGEGEVLGFLGPNGAGKTTTMRMLTGFVTPSSGRAWVMGQDVVKEPIAAKRLVGYLPEGAPAYGDMSVSGFLRFVASMRDLRGAELEQALERAVERTALGSVLDRPIDTLSKGFKRRVGLAQAIIHDPPVLVMDEPTDGLDPNQKHDVRTLIESMAAEKAIIVSTHILEEVEAVCTRAVIIADGRVLVDETPAELKRRSELHDAVRVRIASGRVREAMGILAALDGIGEIREAGSAHGDTVLFALRNGGGPMVETIGTALTSAGISVAEIGVEQGRLDEVFRALTLSPARPRATSTEAR